MPKRIHEIRDPIHTFIRLDSDERAVVDSRPLQRLRHIHQLGVSHLVYPGATHKRFEHSLGVMELASRVFDVITREENVRDGSVRGIVPSLDELQYWRRVVRMAALCHDVGHLPFSHVAELELLPTGWNHERLTVEIIRCPEMEEIWRAMTPPLRSLDIMKLAVGPKKCDDFAEIGALGANEANFDEWQTILAEIIVGDAFGVDRMDYLLRDSYHAGVAYGRFDHYRLVDTLRILPKEYNENSQELALGVEQGGLPSAEALVLARFFMYTQVYFHAVTRVFQVHLKDFLSAWLRSQNAEGRFPTSVDRHLAITDNEVMAAILKASRNTAELGHDPARRIVKRDHFRLLYQRNPVDAKVNPLAAEQVFQAAEHQFSAGCVRRDFVHGKGGSGDFPVSMGDRRVASSGMMSETLRLVPPAAFDFVFVDGHLRTKADEWLQQNRDAIIAPKDTEATDGSAST